MVRISIASLIYKSPQLADWVYESIHDFTPMLKWGEAEFFFVANDPTPKLLSHLRAKGYTFIEQYNKKLTDEDLFEMGFAWPEYIHRVYRGYNRAILHSKGEIIVLVNSDHYFSADWLENLLKYLDTQKIVCSQLVEPIHPKYGAVFPTALHGEFGNSLQGFDKDGFLDFAMKNRRSGIYGGGAYMPCMFNKDIGIYAGLYPEGNIAGASFEEISKTGDEEFFDRLSKLGVKHITALDSIVYHLKEGEKDDSEVQNEVVFLDDKGDSPNLSDYPALPLINTKNYRLLIQPSTDHGALIDFLFAKPRPIKIRKRISHFLERHMPIRIYGFLVKIWLFIKRAL